MMEVYAFAQNLDEKLCSTSAGLALNPLTKNHIFSAPSSTPGPDTIPRRFWFFFLHMERRNDRKEDGKNSGESVISGMGAVLRLHESFLFHSRPMPLVSFDESFYQLVLKIVRAIWCCFSWEREPLMQHVLTIFECAIYFKPEYVLVVCYAALRRPPYCTTSLHRYGLDRFIISYNAREAKVPTTDEAIDTASPFRPSRRLH